MNSGNICGSIDYLLMSHFNILSLPAFLAGNQGGSGILAFAEFTCYLRITHSENMATFFCLFFFLCILI